MKKLRRLLLVGLLVASYTAAFVACEEDPALTEDDTTQSGENPLLDSTKTALYKPVAIDSVHEYSGNKRYITLAPIYDSLMTVVGDTAVNAGSYTALVALKDTAAYCWKDGSTDTVRVAWRIARKVLYLPFGTGTTQHLYDGNECTLVDPTRFDSTLMTLSGTTAATEVGSYECTVSLKDTANYMWHGGTTADVVIPWQIVLELDKGKTRLPKPSNYMSTWSSNAEHWPTPALRYIINGVDINTLLRFSGNHMYTRGGQILRFSVAIKDTASYVWDDGTVDSVPVTFLVHRFLTDIMEAKYTLSPKIHCYGPNIPYEPSLEPPYQPYITSDSLPRYSAKAAAIYEYIQDKHFTANPDINNMGSWGATLQFGDMVVTTTIDGLPTYPDDPETATELRIYEHIQVGSFGLVGYSSRIEDFHPTAQEVFRNLYLINGKIVYRYTEYDSEYTPTTFEFIFEQSGVAPQP